MILNQIIKFGANTLILIIAKTTMFRSNISKIQVQEKIKEKKTRSASCYFARSSGFALTWWCSSALAVPDAGVAASVLYPASSLEQPFLPIVSAAPKKKKQQTQKQKAKQNKKFRARIYKQ